MREAIHELKYRNIRALAAPLAALLGDYLTHHPVPGDVLVPVPLHRKRLRERGYNQSGLLSRELGKLINLPVVEDCLVRRQPAPPQARTASVSERRSNVAGAFACRDGSLRGKPVLLVDDVATSGATLNACAVALKSAGASPVWGLVVAKEV
jgi:ComF family protein